MPQPTSTQVHVDRVLTNISIAYAQNQNNFIATKVFPIVPVEHQSDVYYTFTKNDWFRDEAKPRADGDQSAGGGFGLSTEQYLAEVNAYHSDVGPQARANQDDGLNLDRAAAEFVTRKLLLRQEIQWASDVFATGIWGTDATPSTLWSSDSSDPISDIETGKETILTNTGFEPNTLVLGYQVFRRLRNHPDLIDRVKYTGVGRQLNEMMLAQLFDVERVMVAKAIKTTNLEGETAGYALVHGKHAWLGYVAPSPNLLTPSAGYTFSWDSMGGIGDALSITREEIPLTRGAVRVEAQSAWDNKIVAADLGYFFNSAVS
jgi:hypothetical protein